MWMYAYGAPIEPRTTRGLRWCMVAFAVYVLLMIIQIVFGAWMTVALAGVDLQTPYSQLSSLVMMMLLLVAVVSIVGVLVMVFYFMGFGYMYAGRDELGQKHSRNVWISFLLIIGAIVAYGVGKISQIFISFSIFGTNYGNADAMKDLMTKQIVASSISGGIVAAFVAAAISLSILALIPPGRRFTMFAATTLGTATPGIVGSLGLLQISGLVDRLYRSGYSTSLDASTGLPMIVGASLGIVTFLLFLIVYNKVYKAIKTGELRPVVKPPTPVWVPTAFVYPAMPYQPFQPIQPPYSQPPQPQPPSPPKSPSDQN